MLGHQMVVTAVCDRTGESFGVMRSMSAIEKTGENTLDRPGGMAPPEAFVGTWEYGPITIGRALSHGKDSGLIQKAFELHGERFTLTAQPVDSKGQAGFHKPLTASGLLNGSTSPEYASDNNDRQVLEMVLTIDSVV